MAGPYAVREAWRYSKKDPERRVPESNLGRDRNIGTFRVGDLTKTMTLKNILKEQFKTKQARWLSLEHSQFRDLEKEEINQEIEREVAREIGEILKDYYYLFIRSHLKRLRVSSIGSDKKKSLRFLRRAK